MDQNRRHIVLINKSFQFNMIAKFIIINIIIMIVFGFILYLFLNSEVDSNLHSAHVTYKNIKDMLFPIIITLSIINILVSSIIIAVFVLFASHKVAGPLYRFNEALKDICNRNLNTFTGLREGDQLYECSHTLTQAAKLLAGDMSDIKAKTDEIKDMLVKSKPKAKTVKKVEDLENIVNLYRV
jgi:hypothetical protein